MIIQLVPLLIWRGGGCTKWGVLSGFGILLAAAFALGLKYVRFHRLSSHSMII